ncbi:protein COP1 SUPPRESSOR 2 isoform X2 [Coffea arabica]|uniref:Protein COP1 SUPPRESSOR 2 isoform X2 n=1 Tax=Coffea arabica TaxID=13443 RepID=A0ABM4WKK8_COFAR
MKCPNVSLRLRGEIQRKALCSGLLVLPRYKLRNIEETEVAKKLLQEKRLMGRTKTDSSIPSSYSADYLQRGKDYAEKLRRGNEAENYKK